VFDTITGPGVLEVTPEVRLKPFRPKTPCGMPTLIGVPPLLASSEAAELPVAVFVLGDCLTVSGACSAVPALASDMAVDCEGAAVDARPADGPLGRG